jgi:hypothetical protein
MPTMGRFPIWTKHNVHLMGQCCPIHTLKVNKLPSFHRSSRFTPKHTEACQRTLKLSSDCQVHLTFSQPTSLEAISTFSNLRVGQHSSVSSATRLRVGELDNHRLVRYDSLSFPNCPEWLWDPPSLAFNT